MTETIQCENVNGVMLTLSTVVKSETPKSRYFSVSYKRNERKSWPKSILFAVIFNILSLIYIRISLTAIVTIIVVLSFLVLFWVTHSVQTESLLVVPSIGIQSSVKYVYGKEDNFIPWNIIDDIIINEVIKMNRVIYILTVLVKVNADDSESIKLIPLFKHTKPRLSMIERVYSQLQALLTEDLPRMGAGDTG